MLRKIITISLVSALAVAARGQEDPHPEVSSAPVERQQTSQSVSKTPGSVGGPEQNSSHKSLPTWTVRITRDRMEPTKADMPLINQAAGFMQENPATEMLIVGYAGGTGTEEYNLALGERRAKTVQQLLVARGVEPARLTITTAGAVRPYSVSATGRKTYLPHRVELIIR